MQTRYIVYLSLKDSCEVEFSGLYNSYNSAKEEMNLFLNSCVEKRGGKMKLVLKEELEKLKLVKHPENCIYVKRKTSEAILYSVITSVGTFYNTYNISKFGKSGITEILISNEKEVVILEKNKGDKPKVDNEITFLTELKNILSKRESSSFSFPDFIKRDQNDGNFVSSLVEQKANLKKVN